MRGSQHLKARKDFPEVQRSRNKKPKREEIRKKKYNDDYYYLYNAREKNTDFQLPVSCKGVREQEAGGGRKGGLRTETGKLG